MKKRPANWKHPIPRDAIIPHISSPHIPGVDDYELPSEIDIDYSKAKPNPYAGKVQWTHGGARKGAGRKPAAAPMERHTITLHKTDVSYLRKLDLNLSRAIRKLIAAKGK